MSMEYQLSTASARAELEALKQVADKVAAVFESTSQSIDKSVKAIDLSGPTQSLQRFASTASSTLSGALSPIKSLTGALGSGLVGALRLVDRSASDLIDGFARIGSAALRTTGSFASYNTGLGRIGISARGLMSALGPVGIGLAALAAVFSQSKSGVEALASSFKDRAGPAIQSFWAALDNPAMAKIGSAIGSLAGLIVEKLVGAFIALQNVAGQAFEKIGRGLQWFDGPISKLLGISDGAVQAGRSLEKFGQEMQRAGNAADPFARKLDGSTESAHKLADSLREVSAEAAAAFDAMSGFSGKTLEDFGVKGFDNDDVVNLKRMQELQKQFDADAKAHDTKQAGATRDASASDARGRNESHADYYKRMYGVDILSGRELSSNRNFFDQSTKDANGAKIDLNTQAIRESIQAFERNTGVLQEAAANTASLDAGISNFSASVDNIGAGLGALQASVDGVNTGIAGLDQALQHQTASISELTASTDEYISAVNAMTEEVEPLAGMLENNNQELASLNEATLPSTMDALSDVESAVEYNTDANYFAGDAANSLAEATAALEASMNDAAAEISSAVSNSGGGGGGDDYDGGGGGDTGYVETPEFSGGGISHRKRPTRKVPINAFSKAPRFADGGIPSILHPNEAVIPLQGGAVPVTLTGGNNAGALSAGFLSVISDTLRAMRQDFKDTQLVFNNVGTLAHNDAVKTHQYLQLLQDMEVEQTKIISELLSSFDVLSSKLLDNLNQIESLIQAARSSGGGGGGGGERSAIERAGAMNGTGTFDLAAEYRKYGLQMPQTDGGTGYGFGGNGIVAGYVTEWDEEKQTRVAKLDKYGRPISVTRGPGNVILTGGGDPKRGGLGSFASGSPNAARDLNGGFQATLHPDEAVIPLPDGRSVPVDIDEASIAERVLAGMGGSGTTINVNMTVHTQDAGSFNKSREQILRDMGASIRQAERTLGRGQTVFDPTRRGGGK